MNLQERAEQQLQEQQGTPPADIRAESQKRYNDSFKAPRIEAQIKRSRDIYEVVNKLDAVLKAGDSSLKFRESLAGEFTSVRLNIKGSLLNIAVMIKEACDVLNNSRFKYDFLISIEAIRNALIVAHSQGDALIDRGYDVEVHLVSFLSMKNYDKRVDFLQHQKYDFSSELAELEKKENFMREGENAGISLVAQKIADAKEAQELAEESEMLERIKRDEKTLERLKEKGLLSV